MNGAPLLLPTVSLRLIAPGWFGIAPMSNKLTHIDWSIAVTPAGL
jgi:hypothetical protein